MIRNPRRPRGTPAASVDAPAPPPRLGPLAAPQAPRRPARPTDPAPSPEPPAVSRIVLRAGLLTFQ